LPGGFIESGLIPANIGGHWNSPSRTVTIAAGDADDPAEVSAGRQLMATPAPRLVRDPLKRARANSPMAAFVEMLSLPEAQALAAPHRLICDGSTVIYRSLRWCSAVWRTYWFALTPWAVFAEGVVERDPEIGKNGSV